MAKYNELQVGRYNRFLQKLLSMKGPASLESLNPELQAIILAFHGVENRYLEAWDRFGKTFSVAAQGAGVNTVMRIRNPGGSNVIGVLEYISGGSTGALNPQIQVSVGASAVDQAGLAPGAPFDPRGRGNATLIVSAGNNPQGTNILNVPGLPNTTLVVISDENQEIPVLPGQFVDVACIAPNQPGTFSMFWRERFLEDSERA